MEYPSELIQQLKISFRKEAGVPCYDPEDPTLRDLPSLQQVIEGSDPSPPYLRCKQCRGTLIRGLQSIVCVYCGARQHKQIPPDPLPFKSTCGYAWLLRSLHLDGSETIEASDSNRGHNSSKDVMVLSDLFNIELQWPAESEKKGADALNKVPNQINSPLNLAGVDLNNFFSETKNESVPKVQEQEFIPNKPAEIMGTGASSGQGSLSLFENTQSSESFVRPADATDEDSSGWDAEFQSAGVKTFAADSNAHNFSQDDSSLNHTIPMGKSFGSEAEIEFEYDGIHKNASEKIVPGGHASINDTWIQDDQWKTSNMESSTKIAQAEIKSEVMKDGWQVDNSKNLSSMDNDLFQDDLWLTGTAKHGQNEESFDAWQEFTSLGKATDPFPSVSNLTSVTKPSADEFAPEQNLLSLSNNFQEMEFDTFMAADHSSANSSHQNGSTSVNMVQEGSYPDRSMDVYTGDLKITDSTSGGFDAKMVPESESTDETIKNLMSQMHDLSFMLDSKLSIPEKEDRIDSTS